MPDAELALGWMRQREDRPAIGTESRVPQPLQVATGAGGGRGTRQRRPGSFDAALKDLGPYLQPAVKNNTLQNNGGNTTRDPRRTRARNHLPGKIKLSLN
jgi:hypothetical protein